jgi:hypothetical protein
MNQSEKAQVLQWVAADLGAAPGWSDLGDLAFSGQADPIEQIEQATGQALAGG